MTKSPRPLRVADRIQVELSEIIQRRLKDPRLGFLTVTGVDVPPDLRSARVFVSTLRDEDVESMLAGLEHAKGFLRRELGKRLQLRHVPDLEFKLDRSAARGTHMENLLRRISDEERGTEGDDPAAGEEE